MREYVERGALAVRRNHDAAIGAAAPESANADIRASIRWTRERLDPSQRAFLESMPLLHPPGADR